ncbi:hypothetical protein BIW11_03258 [Tropilaelaps mercedesae]|uniref:EB domain-containing protein n=1 Tax=Tropilaelaps mercedesae TaxID=418985 RepID=A0A1V9XPU7_9ACAR|nr:hypothetical protein BIW11_03258 [Tropilaelaps mercedesae]
MSHEEELPYYYDTNECTTDTDCTAAHPDTVCDAAQTRCICLYGLFRDVTVREVRCVYGKQLDQWCSTSKQCHVVNLHTSCVGSFMRSLCKCSHGFYLEQGNQTCVRYPEGEMYMVDEADKIMFFNANFMAFAVFVFLAIVILAIQKDLICDILKGKISPLNDAMNAENANEGVDRIQSTSSSPSPTAGPANESELGHTMVESSSLVSAQGAAGVIDNGPDEIAVEA